MANEAIESGSVNRAPQDTQSDTSDSTVSSVVTAVHPEEQIHISTQDSLAGTGVKVHSPEAPITDTTGEAIPETSNLPVPDLNKAPAKFGNANVQNLKRAKASFKAGNGIVNKILSLVGLR